MYISFLYFIDTNMHAVLIFSLAHGINYINSIQIKFRHMHLSGLYDIDVFGQVDMWIF